MRIDTIDDLKERLNALFGATDLAFEDCYDYGLLFTVPGRLQPLLKRLREGTDPSCWQGKGSAWFYVSDEDNWLLHLRAASDTVLCHALVSSLHEQFIASHRPPDSQA